MYTFASEHAYWLIIELSLATVLNCLPPLTCPCLPTMGGVSTVSYRILSLEGKTG